MVGLIGEKVGMSSVYDEKGINVPCTVIWSEGCVVTQIKKVDSDGYDAVQLSYGNKKRKNISKSVIGHLKASNVDSCLLLREIRGFDKEVVVGQKLIISDLFNEGELVDVVGKSKGKGFQGVVKRHGFAGVGGQTHGQHNRLRAPGSIGASSFPSRVFKGMRMAGRTGSDRVTVKNLKIMKIIPEKSLIVVKGCVPGDTGSIVVLKSGYYE